MLPSNFVNKMNSTQLSRLKRSETGKGTANCVRGIRADSNRPNGTAGHRQEPQHACASSARLSRLAERRCPVFS